LRLELLLLNTIPQGLLPLLVSFFFYCSLLFLSGTKGYSVYRFLALSTFKDMRVAKQVASVVFMMVISHSSHVK
jgi:hypothetical protein